MLLSLSVVRNRNAHLRNAPRNNAKEAHPTVLGRAIQKTHKGARMITIPLLWIAHSHGWLPLWVAVLLTVLWTFYGAMELLSDNDKGDRLKALEQDVKYLKRKL
jgi:hypothetical protein